MNDKPPYIKTTEIFSDENSRAHKSMDVSVMMDGIKQLGLLHPIVVYPSQRGYEVCCGNLRLEAMIKLGWKNLEVGNQVKIISKPENYTDFLLINLVENAQREDLTPIELGKNIYILHNEVELPLSFKEISSRIGTSLSRVKTAYNLFQDIPKKFHPYIGYHNSNGHNASQKPLNASVASILLRALKGKPELDLYLTESIRQKWTDLQANTVHPLRQRGLSDDYIIQHILLIRFCRINYPLIEEEAKALEDHYEITVNEIIRRIIDGKMEPIPVLLRRLREGNTL